MRTSEAGDLFLAAKSKLQKRTLEEHRYRLNVLGRHTERLPSSPEEVDRFLDTVGPTPETVASYYRFLRNLYNTLIKRGYIRTCEDPMPKVEPPRVPPKIHPSLSKQELVGLLTNETLSPAIRCLCFVLADTGVRLGEAISITSDRLMDGLVVVSGKQGDRVVPISDAVTRLLQNTLPWPWRDPLSASQAICKALKLAGLPGKKGTAKALRHTFMRLWEGDEGVLVDLGGWTTSRMLKRTYRPYNVHKAKKQHEMYRPTALIAPMTLRGPADKRNELSEAARVRLRWLVHYETQGQNAANTCRHFSISRQTFHRWKNRYDPDRLETLEDRPPRGKGHSDNLLPVQLTLF